MFPQPACAHHHTAVASTKHNGRRIEIRPLSKGAYDDGKGGQGRQGPIGGHLSSGEDRRCTHCDRHDGVRKVCCVGELVAGRGWTRFNGIGRGVGRGMSWRVSEAQLVTRGAGDTHED